MHWPRVTRDGLMFVLGAIGFLHEVFVSGPTEHPFLLAASAALMGLPFIFQGPAEGRTPSGGRWRRGPGGAQIDEFGTQRAPWDRSRGRVEREPEPPRPEEDSDS